MHVFFGSIVSTQLRVKSNKHSATGSAQWANCNKEGKNKPNVTQKSLCRTQTPLTNQEAATDDNVTIIVSRKAGSCISY